MSVGWLSCTWVGHHADLEGLLGWLAGLGIDLLLSGRRWRGYDTVYAGEAGLLLGVRMRPEGIEAHLDAPASVLEGMSHERLHALLWDVAAHARNVTRVDVTLDDWDKRRTPWDLELLTSGADDPYTLNKAQMVTRAEQSDFRRSKGPTGGDSWYLGSSKGEARLRVYDKARESRGEVDCIRWELQLRGDSAKAAVVRLVLGGKGGTAQNMGVWAGAELVRFVDFRDRAADSNVTRCPRLDWWAELVGGASRARPVVVPAPMTAERLHTHARFALPSWLATLADTAPKVTGQSPEQWMLDMLQRGRRNRSARHTLALRATLTS